MPNQFLSPEGDLENYFISEYWLIDQYVGDTLWVWGRSNFGQLGDNTTTNRSTPITTFSGGANWQRISFGGASSSNAASIKSDGTLWVWGAAGYGQLGNFVQPVSRNTPVTTFSGGTNWKQVTIGSAHMAAIKTDGTLWTWGRNAAAQLGDNTSSNRCTPITTFAGGTNWKQVVTSGITNHAIKEDGTLWVWGSIASGSMGIGAVTGQTTPVQVGSGTDWKQVANAIGFGHAIKTNGVLYGWGLDSSINRGVSALTQGNPVTTLAGTTAWKQVACGRDFSGAIRSDGTLWMWGANSYGQLGDGTTTSRNSAVTTFAGGTNWKQIACGYRHTVAVKTDGTLWVWGRSNEGQLGNNGGAGNVCTPITTFAGGSNWKWVGVSRDSCYALTSGTDPTYFVS